MTQRLATTLAALLLAGCAATPPSGLPVPEAALKLQRHLVGAVPPQAADQLEALASLDATGYKLGYMPAVLADAHFTLNSVPYEEPEKQLEGVVYADYLTALSAAQQSSVVPSINLIDGLCKQINDGVYARLEVIWEREHTAPLRAKLLQALVNAWKAHPDDAAWQDLVARIAVATSLAGGSPDVPAELQAKVAAEQAQFDATPEMSKPLGFYTLNEELQRIYRSDRMLQRLTYPIPEQPETIHEAAQMAALAGGDAELAKALDDTGAFYQKMANPFRAYSATQLAKLGASEATLYQVAKQALPPGNLLGVGWIPPSGSAEDALFDKAPPEETDLMAYLIRSIRDGSVSLAPKPGSGFYQYQEYALEALLAPEKQPEGAKIAFGDAYLKRLEEAFKTGLAKARETQVKQTCWSCAEPTSVPPPPPKPRMFVEPIGTVYKRYGDMYAFLEREVLPLFPAADLDGALPIEETGAGPRDVRAQVAYGKQLMYGLYLVNAYQLGLKPDDVPATVDVAKQWLASYQTDAYIARDTRIAVPIRQTKDDDPLVTYWGTAGVTLIKLQLTFDKAPSGFYGAPEPATYFVAADKFISFQRRRSKGLLDRAAYRQILDGATSLGEALQRLQG